MAIKLLGHVWRSTAPASAAEPRRGGNDWVVEPREPSRWNPASVRNPMKSRELGEATATEPTWAETQPWCHG